MRGEFSADVARKNGARNVEIVGCPSNFINASERHLGRGIADALKTMKDPHRLSINLDFNEHLAPIVQRCISWMEEWGGFLVTQGPLDAIQCALGAPELLLASELERYAEIMLGRSYDEAARKFLSARLITFFDTEAWLLFLRSCSLAIGTRLHGNILALQAGTPAVIIPHDSRTRELAETIRMPVVEPETVMTASSLPDLLSQVEFDGEAYDQRRAELAATYVGIFEASGVPVTRELKQLATAPAEIAAQP